MNRDQPATLNYTRSRFATALPLLWRYTAAHAWLAPLSAGGWRVGLTKLGSRLLGEVVEYGFDVAPGAAVTAGQLVGFIEGFKAVSDLTCAGDGRFLGENPALAAKPGLVNEDPQGAGWLYEFEGTPDARCLDVHGYGAVLDRTLDRLLAKPGENTAD